MFFNEAHHDSRAASEYPKPKSKTLGHIRLANGRLCARRALQARDTCMLEP